MDFARFLHLIEQKSLWFSRPDQFDDPLVRTYTDGEIEHFRSLYSKGTIAGTAVGRALILEPQIFKGVSCVMRVLR